VSRAIVAAIVAGICAGIFAGCCDILQQELQAKRLVAETEEVLACRKA
jgi:hypothetical protein